MIRKCEFEGVEGLDGLKPKAWSLKPWAWSLKPEKPKTFAIRL